jgi:iron complex transport system permease protein
MTEPTSTAVTNASRGHGRRILVAGVGAVLVVTVIGVAFGPATQIRPWAALLEIVDRIPGVALNSGLNERQAATVWDIRFPRVVLGLLVGWNLSSAGAAYQGVFRNPLADPYLLGAAAGAGLGATLIIVRGHLESDPTALVPVAAFLGALTAVALTYLVGATGDRRRAPASLLLAGVAVTSLFTAMQTFVQQRHASDIRAVYTWILGRLSTAGWHDVVLLAPYVVVPSALLLVFGRSLDVLSVGDDEARSLGLDVDRTRLIVVLAASLATAGAVAVSGLIGFVGIVVPHAVRLAGARSYRILLPASMLFGGAFLVLADLLARTAMAPAEIPIGVVTAFCGAPFFVFLLRRRSVGVSA